MTGGIRTGDIRFERYVRRNGIHSTGWSRRAQQGRRSRLASSALHYAARHTVGPVPTARRRDGPRGHPVGAARKEPSPKKPPHGTAPGTCAWHDARLSAQALGEQQTQHPAATVLAWTQYLGAAGRRPQALLLMRCWQPGSWLTDEPLLTREQDRSSYGNSITQLSRLLCEPLRCPMLRCRVIAARRCCVAMLPCRHVGMSTDERAESVAFHQIRQAQYGSLAAVALCACQVDVPGRNGGEGARERDKYLQYRHQQEDQQLENTKRNACLVQ